jgi:23S rRNA (adenine2503-C2)-methyltransferase
VIPYNPVAGLLYRTPSGKAIERFREILEHAGINVQFRHRKGDKINAACGQLRRSSVVELTT